MKKVGVFLVVLTLLMALTISVHATSAEVSVAVSKEEAYVGDEITVTISVSSSTPYTAILVDDIVDEQVFEVDKYEIKADIPTIMADYSDDSFVAKFEDNGSYSGVLITLYLRVKATQTFAPTTIGGKDVVLKNGNDPVVVTNNSKQVQIRCRHNFVSWNDAGNGTHTSTCSIPGCGQPGTAAHEWQNAGTATPAGCETPGSQPIECKFCHVQSSTPISAKGHAYDNNCDTTCNNGCGTTRAASHKYEAGWSYDAQSHWHKCSVCGDKKDAAAHTAGPAATETAGQLCTVCPYVIKEPLGHIHQFEDRWQQDADYHWRACMTPGCYVQDSYSKHVYDDDCDVSCNTCGHIRVAPHTFGTELHGNAKGHWTICTLCGETSEVFPHVPGEEATMDTPQLCTECQVWIKCPLGQEHTYGDVWNCDDVNHWKVCEKCSEIADGEAHSWDEGTVVEQPTEDSEGSVEYTCQVCHTKRTATLPKLEKQTTEPTDNQPIVPSANDGGFPWWILIVIAGLLMLAGIGLFVFEFIRSRKHNMHGKFSNK